MDEIDKLRQEIIKSETFCFYPFLELSTNPAGHIKPCCYFSNVLLKEENPNNYTNSFNILKGDRLEEAWNSQNMISIRKKLYLGEIELHCQTCTRDGNASMRTRSIREYKNNYEILNLVNDTIKNNYVADHMPTRLELKPSNLCNLKCVMCNSYDSSQVSKELKDLSEKYNGIEIYTGRFVKITPDLPGIHERNGAFSDVEQPDWSNDPTAWNSIIKIIPGLEVLSFAGGEPTLIPFVHNLLEYCVNNNYAKNIKVFLSSNFTNINKKFVELMPHFKQFEIIASIDGIEKTNDYCRYPSHWEQISRNYQTVKQMVKHHPNIKILVNITVSLLNIMNLDKLLYWIDDQANCNPYFKEWPYNINLIWAPTDQRIENLPPEMRLIVIQKLELYKSNSTVLKDFPELFSKVDLVINELSKPYTEENKKQLDNFVNRISVLDDHRGIKIYNYIPELRNLF